MELKYIVESILFTAQKPMNIRELREVLAAAADKSEEEAAKPYRRTKEEELIEVLTQLEKEHAENGRSYCLACVAGAWQFVARPEYMPWLKTLFGIKSRPPKLSQPGLETLAIIAYRQPITRAEIEQIRGVAVDGVVSTLLERGLIENAGRAEVVGRPMTYATTSLFLEYFGLRDLDQLPAADELRRIPVQKPESLLTVEAGLATAPPEGLQPDSSPASQSPEATDKPTEDITEADTDTRTESSSLAPEHGDAPRTESSAGTDHQSST